MAAQRWNLQRFGLAQMIELGREIRTLEDKATSFEDASKALVEFLRERFTSNGEPDCPLVRLYRTRRFEHLTGDLQDFARTVADTSSIDALTRCLELVATAGTLNEWNDPRLSAGHRAIPLISEEAVLRLPMVARLITQFGVDVASLATTDTSLVLDPSRQSFGVFHIEEAKGSPYVPAQDDFVNKFSVRSVLGFGGLLPDGELFAVIIFSTVPISLDTAKLFETIALHVRLLLIDASEEHFDVVAVRMATLEQLLDVHEGTGGVALQSLEVERLRLLNVFERAPALICLMRLPDYEIEFVNPSFSEAIAGRDVLGQPIDVAFPEITEQGLIEMFETVASTGQPFHANEVPVSVDRTNTGVVTPGFFNLSLLPVVDPDGTVTGIISFSVEVTEMVNARREVESLVESLRELSRASLEINSLMSAQEMSEVLANRSLALVGAIQSRVEINNGLGDELIVAEAGTESEDSEIHEESIQSKQGPIGRLQVFKKDGFTSGDCNLLAQIAGVAAVALDNVRLYEREHRIAEVLQRSLLPEHIPAPAGIRLATRYQPGTDGEQVGGDWYDVIEMSSGDLLLVLGDVSGRGVRAASVMGQLRTAIRAYAIAGYSPTEILENCDALLQDLYRDQMATVVLALVAAESSTVRFATAGHPAPMIIPAEGEPYLIDIGQSVPLGVIQHANFAAREVVLEPGWTILLYTDGLIERRTESLDVGFERLLAAARSAPSGVEALSDHILEQLSEAGQSDDIALLACSTVPELAASLEVTVTGEADRAAGVRHTLAGWLTEQNASPSEIFDIVAFAGEALANSCEHGYRNSSGMINLTASSIDGIVTLRVRDRGKWKKPVPDSQRGRGMMLMRTFRDTVDVHRSPEGTVVTATRRLRGEAHDRAS